MSCFKTRSQKFSREPECLVFSRDPSILPVTQPHPWAVAVLINEDDAGGFQGGTDGGEGTHARVSGPAFYVLNAHLGKTGGFSQIGLLPLYERASGAYLCRADHVPYINDCTSPYNKNNRSGYFMVDAAKSNR